MRCVLFECICDCRMFNIEKTKNENTEKASKRETWITHLIFVFSEYYSVNSSIKRVCTFWFFIYKIIYISTGTMWARVVFFVGFAACSRFLFWFSILLDFCSDASRMHTRTFTISKIMIIYISFHSHQQQKQKVNIRFPLNILLLHRFNEFHVFFFVICSFLTTIFQMFFVADWFSGWRIWCHCYYAMWPQR